MTLEDIFELWSKDCDIDRTELGEESLKIAQLHAKYFKIFSTERLSLRKLQSDLKVLKKYLTENSKILSSRITSVSQNKQRKINREVRRAKVLGLL